MKFKALTIPGVFLIEAEPHADERGVFRRHFCTKEFRDHDLNPWVLQCNVSENVQKHTLRGFHYQAYPYGEAKTISVFDGAAFVVAVDLRPGSETYLKYVSEYLDTNNRKSLHVPAGCAAAFLTLMSRTVLHYYASAPYVPEAERGIRWNDPALGVEWPAEPKVISAKDASWGDFTR